MASDFGRLKAEYHAEADRVHRDDWLPTAPAYIQALEVEVERLEASVERTARAFRACEQGRADEAKLHAAEIERQTALRKAAFQDNSDKTAAVRELQDALRGVLASWEAYELLAGETREGNEYEELMRARWARAAALVPGFDVKAPGPWVAEDAGEAQDGK